MGTTSNLNQEFSLCGGCQTTGTLYLKVEENASSGAYPVDISVVNSEGYGVVEKSVLEVDGSSELLLNGNGSVKQGEDSELNLEMENIGQDSATQVTAYLQYPGITFQPSRIGFGNLEPGETVRKTVKIHADEKVVSGPVTVSSTVEYREDSSERIRNSSVPLKVLKDVHLAVSKVDSEAEVSSSSGFMVELENIGSSEAEQIRSNLRCADASVLSGESFVGSLEEGESVPTTYSIRPNRKEVQCSIQVSYTGENEKNLEESFSVTAEDIIPMLPVLVPALVAFAGLVYWKKRSMEP
jgi:hypothetical protein